MTWRGVIFDLFGTLVPPFRKAEHTSAIQECAKILDLDFELCHSLWIESFPQRVSGGFASIASNFAWIGEQAGITLSREDCLAAAAQYAEFTRAGLEPLAGVNQALTQLKSAGLRLGLLTNCAPDVPEVLAATPLGAHFDAAVFSCSARIRKPERPAYDLVLQEIGTRPEHTLYVGDGSDDELRGAAEAGLRPLLVTPSLANTYDSHRPAVENWKGPRVATIPAVLSYLDIR
ncbi:HAD family hydrolase [Streptosporangium sp. NPDC020072]|uniref:HAD family hydrolase n=1 Tax=Streptosporangium sp. NPDC020072 TaxID=3154788 RepID=UPI00342BC586